MDFQNKANSKKAVPVFQVEKKHSQASKLFAWIELALVVVVILGTVIWILLAANFSFKDFFGNFITNLKPKTATLEAIKKLSIEDQIKASLKEQHLFEIVQFSQTQEGNYEVHSKEGLAVFFSSEKNITEQVTTLQTLLTKAKIDNKSLKKVDFRFAKIVAEY